MIELHVEVALTSVLQAIALTFLVIMMAAFLNQGTRWRQRRDRKQRLDRLYPPQ